MNVLLSIKPEFALRIFDGSKKYEYRRVIFKRNDVKKVFVYASSPISKIIGEFEIDMILSDSPTDLWDKTKKYSGVSKKLFFNYFSDKDMAYAIKIKKSISYDTPVSLQESLGVNPPQSFIYVESFDWQ